MATLRTYTSNPERFLTELLPVINTARLVLRVLRTVLRYERTLRDTLRFRSTRGWLFHLTGHIGAVHCPGCNTMVGPKRRQKHLSVCPKPSSDIERLRAFAGQISPCRYCGRVLSDLFLAQHEGQCKFSPKNRTGQATGLEQSYPGCRPRPAEDLTPRPCRFDSVCKLCKQQIGRHSMKYHLANECTKKPALAPPQFTPSHKSGWKDERAVGWWHGGE